jgi:tRNA threonylcarbamoyl adenosine modification protein YjeE
MKFEDIGESSLFAVAGYLADLIRKKPTQPTTLYLTGDLGAGKTTLVRSIMRILGLPPAVPVVSPTYTYCVEYDIPPFRIAHVDLYRLEAGADDFLNEVESSVDILFVEWPERLRESRKPDFQVEIAYSGTSRSYVIL